MNCGECLYNEKVGGKQCTYELCHECEEDILHDKKQTTYHHRTRDKRRKNTILEYERWKTILSMGYYIPHAGIITGDWVDVLDEYGKCIDFKWIEGNYIQDSSKSRAQRFLKRYTSKKIRRMSNVPNGNAYRKLQEYWHILY